jgi:hypothetical protein
MGEAEAQAIFGYTTVLFYQKLNELLRDGVKLEKTALLTALLNRSLGKLPPARKSREGTIRRGVNIREDKLEEFLEKHKVGKQVSYKEFTSAASYEIEPFWSNANVRITIIPKESDSKGRDITELAFGTHFIEILSEGKKKNDTDEALFMTDSRFQVVERIEDIERRTTKDSKSDAEMTREITVYNITLQEI